MFRHDKHQHAVAILSAALALSTLAIAPAASAATSPKLTQWKCEDFIAIEEVNKPKVLYWASAHAHPGWESPKKAALDIVQVEKMIPVVIEECRAQPKANFFKKVKHYMNIGGE